MKMNSRTSLLATLFLGLSTLAAVAQEAAPGVKEKTMMDLFHEGGWVMYPITICSVAMIWFIFDGFLRTGAKKLYPTAHVVQLRDHFRAGDYVAAHEFAKNAGSPLCDVVRAGVALSPDGKTMTEEAIIGLTGTVTGMMKAFEKLGSSGVGDPSKLAEAIGEVLVATASGLFIAIPAFISYYLLRNRIQKGIHDVTEIVGGLFRGFPYAEIEGKNVGGDELYAAKPVWNTEPVAAEVKA